MKSKLAVTGEQSRFNIYCLYVQNHASCGLRGFKTLVFSTWYVAIHTFIHFYNHAQGTITNVDPIVLTGDRAPMSRFGTSVTRLGDVNDDGFEGI